MCIFSLIRYIENSLYSGTNENVYRKFLLHPSDETQNKIKQEISSLYFNDQISDKVFKVLQNDNPVIGKFRVLAKLKLNLV